MTRFTLAPAALLAACLHPLGARAESLTQPLDRKAFDVRHELKVTLPEGARKFRVWFAMPQDDPAQKVSDFKVDTPFAHRLERDSEGNQEIFVEGDASSRREFSVLTTFRLERTEVRSGVDAARSRAISSEELARYAHELAPNTHVIIDERVQALSKEITGAETNPVLQARKLYDWVLANVDYWVKDPKNKEASPVGDTEYCLISRTGNCTDFHSLWTSLARAAGIPTRMVYGSFFKSELDGVDTDQSYHCWPEFWAPGFGWVPHDVAIADIYAGDFETTRENESVVRRTTGDGYRGKEPERVTYYFGNLDARRVTWSRGRDLTLRPPQDGGPVNAMAKAYVEVDGKPLPEKEGWVRALTYREVKAR